MRWKSFASLASAITILGVMLISFTPSRAVPKNFGAVTSTVVDGSSSQCSVGTEPPLCQNGEGPPPPACLLNPPVCALDVEPSADCTAPLDQPCN